MRPAAVLSAIVKVQGIKTANVALYGMQAELMKTDVAGSRMGRTMGKLGTVMKTGLAGAAILTAYGLGKAASAGADFNQRLDTTQAVLKASGGQMEKLRKQALRFGETTVYSANSAADAQKELAKGGLTVEQIFRGGLKSALNLAQAGEIEMGESAEYVANAMNLFGLKGKEAEIVANGLAIAANDTTAEVGDFGMALKQAGGVARLAGYDFYETTAGLEALAKSGIKNSDAGTSMKTAIIQLLKPSKKQKDLQEEYNIVLEDSHGHLKSASELSIELTRAFGKMTDVQKANKLATLGGTDGVRYLNAVLEAGPKKLEKYEKKLKSKGYAEEVAAQKTDNLKGDLSKMGNQLEAVGIKIETAAEPIAREFVQAIDAATESISNWDIPAFITEVEDMYEAVNQATHIEVFGSDFSLVPEAEEAVEAYAWIENAAKNSGEAVVEAWEWTENAEKNIGNAAVTAFYAVGSAIEWIVGAYEDFVGWISNAGSNVVDFVKSLIPLQIAALLVYQLIMKLIDAFEFIKPALDIAINFLKRTANVLEDVFGVAIEGAIIIIKTWMKFIGNLASVFADVVSLIVKLLQGDWSGAWRVAGDLVTDVWHTITDVIKGAWKLIKTAFSGGIKILLSILSNGFGFVKESMSSAAEFIGNVFLTPWETIESIFEKGLGVVEGVINKIIDVINIIPGVNIDHVGGSSGKENKGTGYNGGKKHSSSAGYAEGGKVSKPIAIMGEEAPKHHEWVIATNPAYKKANMGYWAKAGQDLGVPGFAKGGLFGGSVPGFSAGGLFEDFIGAAKDVGETAVEYSPPGLAFKGAKAGVDIGEELVGKGAGWLISKLPKPNLPFPFGSAADYAVEQAKVYIESWFGSAAAEKYKQSAAAAMSVGGAGGFTAPPGDMKQFGDNAYVDSHTLAVTAYGDAKFGLSQSSGFRSVAHNAAIGGAPGSLHTHGSESNPGATDSVGSLSAMNAYVAWMKSHVAGLQEAMVDNYAGLGDNAHIGFFKEGGHFTEATAGQISNAEHISKNLISKGLNYKGTAGVVGNAWRESNWEPSAEGTGGGGLWGFTTSPISLADLKAAGGSNWTDLDFQTEFMWGSPGNAQNLKSALNGQESAAKAAEFFDSEWEHSGIKAMSDRVAGAHEVMRFLTGSGIKLGEGAEETPHEEALKSKKEEAEKLKREGKARKAAREAQLKVLWSKFNERHTQPAKASGLWQINKFLARNEIGFDKDERAKIISDVISAASSVSYGDEISGLRGVAHYMEGHGEITGKDPDNYTSMLDAMTKAQSKGADKKKKHMEKIAAHKAAKRAKQIDNLEAKGTFPNLVAQLENYSKMTDASDEYAGQITSLAPEEMTDSYVEREQSAVQGSLNNLAGWRDTAVGGKDIVSAKMTAIREQIKAINELKKKIPFDKSKENPVNWEMHESERKKKYDAEKWKIGPLENAINAAKEFREETLEGTLDELSPQTKNGLYNPLPQLPNAGMFGGRIFDTQLQYRELGLKEEAVADKGKTPLEELELQKATEDAENWHKRFIILREQQGVMANFDSVDKINGLALGGEVAPTWVGERGKELLVPRVGSRVVSATDASQAARDMGGTTTVVIEQLIVHEDGTVTAETGGKDLAVEVRNINREDVRKATFGSTPGGTTR